MIFFFILRCKEDKHLDKIRRDYAGVHKVYQYKRMSDIQHSRDEHTGYYIEPLWICVVLTQVSSLLLRVNFFLLSFINVLIIIKNIIKDFNNF